MDSTIQPSKKKQLLVNLRMSPRPWARSRLYRMDSMIQLIRRTELVGEPAEGSATLGQEQAVSDGYHDPAEEDEDAVGEPAEGSALMSGEQQSVSDGFHDPSR